MKKIFFYVCLTLTFFACKSKKITSDEGIDFSLKSQQILQKHKNSSNVYNTLSSNVLAKVDFDNNQQNLPLTYRAKKGEAIWLSVPLGLAKILLNKNQVSFYNKLDKSYFEGSYQIVKEILGVDLDFFSVENLILGNIFFENTDWNLYPSKEGYVGIQEKDDYKIRILLTSFFKLEYLFFEKGDFYFAVKYEYQLVENQYFTKKINVESNFKGKQNSLEIQFDEISLNDEVKMPYRVPSGYKSLK